MRINIREKQLIQYKVGCQPCVFWQTNGCERLMEQGDVKVNWSTVKVYRHCQIIEEQCLKKIG